MLIPILFFVVIFTANVVRILRAATRKPQARGMSRVRGSARRSNARLDDDAERAYAQAYQAGLNAD